MLYSLKNVTQEVHGKRILDIPELTLARGGVYAIMGPNGAGKSTLLSLLAFLRRPTSGELLLEGIAPEAASIRNLGVTCVAHDPYVFAGSVGSNVEYGLRIRGISKAERRARVLKALDNVGMAGFQMRDARKLSAGEQRRMCLARALVLRPKVLLLDEPTMNIDKQNQEMIEQIIGACSDEATTVVLCTHDLDQALKLSGNIISMLHGRVVDLHAENIFAADVVREKDLAWAMLGKGVRLLVSTEKEGRVHLSINPESIFISLQPVETSARNVLAGRVTAIAEEPLRMGLMKVYVQAGINLVVVVTEQSFHALGLHVGSPVHVAIKTAAIKVS